MNDDELTMQDAISCRESVYFVSLLRDAELTHADKRRLDQHLEGCKSCQQARSQFEFMHKALDVLLARTFAPST